MAYIVTGDGTVQKPYVLVTDENGIPLPGIAFKSGKQESVALKHGQSLEFLTLPVGSQFAVTEKNENDSLKGYTPSYTVTIAGSTGPHITGKL
jgi:hypothetical protein